MSYISASNFLQHYLGLIQDCRDTVNYHLPCHPGCIPPDCREEIPPGTNWQLDPEGVSSQWVGVRTSDAQWNLVRDRNQWGETHQTGKNLGSNSGHLRRQKGRLITSQRPLVTTSNHSETVSLRFREWGGSTVLCESIWKYESETQPSCKTSKESWLSGPLANS
jgi:hypothetical protein